MRIPCIRIMSESNYKRTKHEKAETDFFDSEDEGASAKKKNKPGPKPRASKAATPSRAPSKSQSEDPASWLSDSEDETQARQKAQQTPSIYSKRVADGTIRRKAFLSGSLIAELRLYNCAEIKDLEGLDRCEKAFVWLRYQGDQQDPEFLLLKKFIKGAKEKFTEEGTFYQAKKKK